MRRRTYLFLAFIFLLCCKSIAEVVVLKSNIREFKFLEHEIEIFEDTTNLLKLADIRKNPGLFRKYTQNELFSHQYEHAYWIRFQIVNASGNSTKWILEVLDSRFKEVKLYSPDTDRPGKYVESITGLSYPFSNRDYEHKNFVFDFPVLQDSSVHEYFLRIDPGVIGSFLFKVRQNRVFSSYGFKEHLLLGMYYGILLIMAFYNLFLFYSIRERVYIYYVFYVLAWAFSSSLEDGLGFQFIWPDFPNITFFGGYISKSLILTLYILYSQSFLDLKKQLLGAHRYLYIILVAYCISSIVLEPFNFTLYFNLILTIIFAYLLYLAYLIYKKGFKPARFFLLGNGIIVAGLLISFLKNASVFSYLEDHPSLMTIMVYIRNITMVIDIVILSIALGERIRYLKKSVELSQLETIKQLNEKKELGEKVNRELEQKVAERTQTIEEQKQQLLDANNQLKSQAEEITRMNAMLDLDNWKLKKHIIQEKEARIALKEIDFVEFIQVYPTESACYNFLEEIKWGEDFTCRKCGHTKYGKGATTFSRRCIKCRYDESLTAYTVFHRCKFDIKIALYIVVMVNRYGKNISIADISREVKVRNATCWKFAQKLLTSREAKKYESLNDNEKLNYLILES
jgi:rubrerythrin